MKKSITGGELGEYPNENYRKFFEKFPEIDKLDVKDWKPLHLISYFCRKYQNYYGSKYGFKFNDSAPSKCFEMFQIKRLGMMLSSNPTILKEYIDWVFENKVPRAKAKLRSISFLTTEEDVNYYKLNFLLKSGVAKVDRSTILPDKFQEPFKKVGAEVKTYGDLAFLSQTELSFELVGAFVELETLGFDKKMLSRIV